MSLIWFDGDVSASPISRVNMRDRGLTLGDGLFETLLVYNSVALWRSEHLDRMEAAAALCGIQFSRTTVEVAIDELLARVDGAAHVLRVTLSRGVSARALAADAERSTLFCTIDSFDMSLAGKPLAVTVSTYRRNPSSFSDQHKTLSYINNVMAARQATATGHEDALMLNTNGHVASTPIANVFVLRGDRLTTPPLEDGVLDGTMRAFLIGQFKAEERSLTIEDLLGAEAVFATNSLRLIRPIHVVDGRPLHQRPVSPYLKAIRDEARRQCGAEIMEFES